MKGKRRAALVVASLGGVAAAAMLALSAGTAMAQTAGTCTNGDAAPVSSGPAAGGTSCPVTASVSITSSTTITVSTSAISWATPASLPATEVSTPVNLSVSTNDGAGATGYVQLYGGSGGADTCGLDNGGSGTGSTIPNTDLKIGVNSSSVFTAATTPGTCPSGGTNAVYTDETTAPGVSSYSDTWQLQIPAGTQGGTFTGILAYEVVGN